VKNLTIRPDATILKAMEELSRTAEKILFVVDYDQNFIGTITDGDIRRHILKEQGLSGTIENAYNTTPTYALQENCTIENIKKVLIEGKLNLIPIIDTNRKIVDYVTWEKAFGDIKKTESPKLNVPVVIMAGGSGTRLEPFTKILPKPLIPVGDKPVIEHIIDKFRNFGIGEFYLTVHHKSKIIRAYFEEKSPDYSIEFAEEDDPRGTAGSIKLLANRLDRTFFVSNCDIIIEADYADLYSFHIKNNYDITLVASAKQFNIPYGVCELNNSGSLKRIEEKPSHNYLVNTGLYVLNADIIAMIPDDGVFHITHLIEKILENHGTIGVYPVSEKAWIDVGQWAEYRKALKLIEEI
jgi:dTDP-glucose pyrophosphorylase